MRPKKRVSSATKRASSSECETKTAKSSEKRRRAWAGQSTLAELQTAPEALFDLQRRLESPEFPETGKDFVQADEESLVRAL